MNSNIIAINTDTSPLRMICATGDAEEPTPFVHDHRWFRTLAGFQRYWKRHCSELPNLRAALPTRTEDALGVIPWLEAQNVTIEYYPWLSYTVHLNGDFEIWGLPESFEGAYALALYSFYRTNARQVASNLWARLSVMQCSLQELSHIAHRLTAALP